MSEKITLYLLSDLGIIIGVDNGKQIKDVAKVLPTSQGQAVTPLFMGGSAEHGRGLDINKKTIQIVYACEPRAELLSAYQQFISGTKEEPAKILMPNAVIPHFKKN